MTKQVKRDLRQIGKRVERLRKYYYASAPIAARVAGISKSAWWKIEQGRCNFCYTTICKVADALYIDVSNLI